MFLECPQCGVLYDCAGELPGLYTNCPACGYAPSDEEIAAAESEAGNEA